MSIILNKLAYLYYLDINCALNKFYLKEDLKCIT